MFSIRTVTSASASSLLTKPFLYSSSLYKHLPVSRRSTDYPILYPLAHVFYDCVYLISPTNGAPQTVSIPAQHQRNVSWYVVYVVIYASF
jgi:hypothetical protein